MPIIEVKNLSKTYTTFKKEAGLLASMKSLFKREKIEVPAAKSISFNIKEGELVGFLGPNGAGKTTTLKMLSGILYPSGGEARVMGYVPWERKPEYQKKFSLVMGQKAQLWWDLPAEDSFVLNKEIYEVSDKDYKKTRDELVELLNVRDLVNTPVRKLSLGERMKCELVAALLHNPKVIYLDEPTIGLDVVSQQKMWEFIKHYNETRQTTIMLTSHYMKDVEKLCKRVIVINDGKIIYDGTLAEIIKKYADYKIIKMTFEKAIDSADIAPYGEIIESNNTYASLRVPKTETAKRVSNILAKLPASDILVEEVPIEDVIRRMFTAKS
ncbi:ATP-binding cassette domain-containing protein [Patescibacteria group bacterium]|nr:MAG: ATP-binding cassette domain-containing protein [Patescibacteria group bacterium]